MQAGWHGQRAELSRPGSHPPPASKPHHSDAVPPKTCPQPSCSRGHCHPCVFRGSGGGRATTVCQHHFSSPLSAAPCTPPAARQSPRARPRAALQLTLWVPCPSPLPKKLRLSEPPRAAVPAAEAGAALCPELVSPGATSCPAPLASLYSTGHPGSPFTGVLSAPARPRLPQLLPLPLLPGTARTPPVQPWFSGGAQPLRPEHLPPGRGGRWGLCPNKAS